MYDDPGGDDDRPAGQRSGAGISTASKASTLAESVFELDRDLNFMMVPATLERITGFSREELELLTLQNVVFLEDRARVLNAAESIFEGSPLALEEASLFSEGKGSHPVHLIMLPRRDRDKVVSVWGAMMDIGDRAVLEERIRTLSEGQERFKTMMRDFVNIMTREIRQPLTTMLLTLELLESGHYGEMPERSRERVMALIEMVDRLKDILNDALEMSRSIGEDFKFERMTISLRELVEEVIKARAPSMKAKGISIKRSYKEGDVLANADRKAIYQVLDSLIGNAVAASPKDGHLMIELETIESSVQIAISDSGDGIPDDEIDHLFDRFYLDPGTDGKGLSDGLNMYLSKRIVQRHGGRIWCESFVGLGSTFFFTLPSARGGI